MTVKELSQLYWLNREIETEKARLEELRQLVSSPSGPNYSGMPRGSRIDNKIEILCAEIADLEKLIMHKQEMCIVERNRLERYICTIPDSLTRQIFTFRFVNGLSWLQVALHIGGGNTEDGVKKVCYRYLNKENKNF